MPYFEPPAASAGIFGNDYTEAVDDSETSTSNTGYQDKLSITTGTWTGTYKVEFHTIVRTSNVLGFMKVRLYDVTNSVLLHEYNEICNVSTNKMCIAGEIDLTFSSQLRNIKVQYCISDGAYTAYISNAILCAWRIA